MTLKTMSRRNALRAFAAAGATAFTGLGAAFEACAAVRRDLPASAAVTVDRTAFLPREQMRRWHVDLDRLGLRATGTRAHDAYIDMLRDRLVRAGVSDVRFEDVKMQRWTPANWGLSVGDGAVFEDVAVSTYIPYSGVGAGGDAAGPLAYLTAEQIGVILTRGPASADLLSGLAGKIVVAETPVTPATLDIFTRHAVETYDRDGAIKAGLPYQRSWLNPVAPSLLEIFGAAGAHGLALITADSTLAKYGKVYAPYDHVFRRLPGLYIDKATGARLRAAAAAGRSARLRLDVAIVPTITRNVIGVIPGRSQELVVLNSHTDGTNGVEDNGPDVIVDIAQYLARLPRGALRRGVMIMLSAGHFAGGNAIQDFLRRHARDGLLDRINCVLTIEHLGLKEWVFNADGELEATGRDEFGALFASDIPALMTAARAWPANADVSPTSVIPPLTPHGDGTANDAVWPGEGEYFWGVGGIPTINYITGPACLLNYEIDTVGYVDFDLLHRQTAASTQLVLDLTAIARSELPRRSKDRRPATPMG
jgi:hypothetical protein